MRRSLIICIALYLYITEYHLDVIFYYFIVSLFLSIVASCCLLVVPITSHAIKAKCCKKKVS